MTQVSKSTTVEADLIVREWARLFEEEDQVAFGNRMYPLETSKAVTPVHLFSTHKLHHFCSLLRDGGLDMGISTGALLGEIFLDLVLLYKTNDSYSLQEINKSTDKRISSRLNQSSYKWSDLVEAMVRRNHEEHRGKDCDEDKSIGYCPDILAQILGFASSSDFSSSPGTVMALPENDARRFSSYVNGAIDDTSTYYHIGSYSKKLITEQLSLACSGMGFYTPTEECFQAMLLLSP